METDSEWKIKRKWKHDFVCGLCKCQVFFLTPGTQVYRNQFSTFLQRKSKLKSPLAEKNKQQVNETSP